MTTHQPPEPQSHHAQYRRCRHQFHLIAYMQKQDLRKGVMISGTSGVGKMKGIEVFLSAKSSGK